jgi:uncharacterized protein YjbJ (UPF0337 family)
MRRRRGLVPPERAQPVGTPYLAWFRSGIPRVLWSWSRLRPEYGAGSLSTTKKEAVVSFADKVRNKAEELGGRIKRNVGEASGDWRLQAEGRADEVRANLKQAGEKIKDALRGRGPHRRHY